jgi:hypothetical protein
MHAQFLSALVLCAAIHLSCGASFTGDQSACTAGSTQPVSQWFLAGDDPQDYAIASDLEVTQSGAPTETIRATAAAPSNFGTVMQTIAPTLFLGQRLTFSAVVKTSGVAQNAGLWMRVDGPKDEGILAFYNMDDQPLTGTSDWTPHEVTLDVAAEARSVSFGLWLNGPGQIWLDSVALVSCGTPDGSNGSGIGTCGDASIDAGAPADAGATTGPELLIRREE